MGTLNALLLAANDKDIIHIDESHELDKQYPNRLVLGHRQADHFVNSKRCPEAIPIAQFSLLLSTTDEYNLLAPLRDRMKLTLRFEYYSDEELTMMLRHRAKALNWPVDEKSCRSLPRGPKECRVLHFGYYNPAVECAGLKAKKPSFRYISSVPATWSNSMAWVLAH